MDYIIKGYKPEKLFHYFEEISAIPRGSGNEKGISDYLVKFAAERNLEVYQDEALNVIIREPGSRGMEDHPAVMLQGHMDMVCEKLSGVEHDFENEGINLEVRDGILRAKGTTLGADNGAAVALMLAVLDDDSLVHPPLECVFTTEEEVGLNGAKALDKSMIRARTMINLDSEEEGIATVSCAGGLRIDCTRPVRREQAEGTLVTVTIEGLLGGHSGSDIDKERQNANQLMARLVYQLMKQTGGKLVSFSGGNKDNAIPRECQASLIYENKADNGDHDGSQAGGAAEAEELARRMAGTFAEEITPFEPGFTCRIDVEKDATASAVPAADGEAFVHMIYLAPNGIQRRNVKMDGFVVTSTNLGVTRADEEELRIVFSPRSSVASLQEEMKERLGLLAETFGFAISYRGEYPGWAYREESKIRQIFQDSYREMTGEELKIEAIHAGLECGLFCDAIPGMDAIAVGPSIYDCHTPDEHLYLDSFERFYQLLADVLGRL